MSLRRFLVCLTLGSLLPCSLAPAAAEEVIEAWRGSFAGPCSVNPMDGSCWVTDSGNRQVVHLAAGGSELSRSTGFSSPVSISVNPSDGSCWVSDFDTTQVVHLAADGSELWRSESLYSSLSLCVNPTDGSCWIADTSNDRVVHLAEDGSESWKGGSFKLPTAVSVNATDGSCWVADSMHNEVVHLAQGGGELCRTGGFCLPWGVSVNQTDGSCWVTDDENCQVVRLAADGTEVWRGGGFEYPWYASVNSADGSCWVAGRFGVAHLAGDGTELWRDGVLSAPTSISVNAADGSCWVSESDPHAVVHLIVVVFPDVPWHYWAFDEITRCFYAHIAAGYEDDLFHPDWHVARDQMAVFLVRALGEEPGNPDALQSWKDAYGYDPAEPSTWEVDFTDVPASGCGHQGGPHWAWFHIQRLYALGVTKGVSETQYGPTINVSRDQMAVFLIRALGLECADPCVDASCWPYDPAEPSTWAHEFGDVPATGQPTCHGAHWAWYHIQALYETGVTLGCGDGSNYCPTVPVRRDEMAAFLARAFLGM